MQISNALNEREFWTCCNKDLERAEGHVIFESAFVSVARLRLLQNSLIRLVRRGVTVCVFLQQPWGWNCRADALPPDAVARIRELKACLRLLSDWGIHVNLRTKVHRKFVIVDRSTHYEGGLNPLSHLGNAEHMRRFDGGSETESIIGKYRLLDCGRCGELLGRYACTDTASFGRRLASYRKRIGTTKSSMERETGVPRNQISRLESGGNATIATVSKLASAVGVTPVLVPVHLVPSVCELLSVLAPNVVSSGTR